MGYIEQEIPSYYKMDRGLLQGEPPSHKSSSLPIPAAELARAVLLQLGPALELALAFA